MKKYLLAGFLFLVQISVFGLTTTFQPAAASASWFVSGNWSAGVPGIGDIVIINAGKTALISNNTPAARCASISFNGSGGITINAGGTSSLTVTGNISGTTGFTNVITNSSTLTIGGSFVSPGTNVITLTTSSGTVIYNGSSAQTIKPATYLNLTKSGTGTTLISGAINVTTAFVVSSGTLTLNGGSINSAVGAPSTTTISGSSTIFNIETTGTVKFGALTMTDATLALGNYVGNAVQFPTVTSTSLNNASTVSYSATASQTVAGITYGILQTASTGSKALSGTVIVNGNLTIGAGTTLAITSYTLNALGELYGGGNITITSGSLNISGNDYNSGSLTAGTGSTVTYNGAVSQSVAGKNYYNLTFTGAGTKILNGTIQIANTFSPGSSPVNEGNSIVEFSGGSQSIPSLTYYGLTLSGSGDKTLSGDVTINNQLDFASSVLLLTSSSNLLIGQDGSISNASASAHIVGKLRRGFYSSVTNDFPIGDGTNLFNVSITSNNITVSASDYLEVSSTECSPLSGCFPTLNTAFTDITKVVNRYFTITNSGFSDVDFKVTVNFLTSDYSGLTINKLLLRAYNQSTMLFEPVTTSGITTTSATGTGIIIPTTGNTIDLVIGEGNPSVCISQASGNWTSTSTWLCGGVAELPDGLDTVIIAPSHVIEMDGNPGNAYSLTINGTASWSTQNNSTYVSDGGIILASTGNISGFFPGLLSTTGDFEMNKASILSSVASAIIELTGGVNQQLKTTAGLPSYTINKLNIGSNVTNNLPALTVVTNLDGTGSITQGSSTSLTITADPSSSLTLDASLATFVTYDGNSTQTILPSSYNNLVISTGSATVTKYFVDGYVYDLTNDLTLTNGSGVLTLDLTSATLIVGGSILGAGTLLANSSTSTVNFSANSGTQNIYNTDYYSLTFTGAGTKALPASLITVAGDFTSSSTITSASGSTLSLDGSGIDAISGTSSFYNLSKTGASTLDISTAMTTVSNLMDITGSGTITSNGMLTIAHGATLMDANASSVFPQDATGYVAVKKTTGAAANRVYYLSGPVNTYTASDLLDGQAVNVLYIDTDGTPTDILKTYTNTCSGSQTGSFNGLYKRVTGSLTPGRGYSVTQTGTKTIDFLGNVNHGDITISPLSSVNRVVTNGWCAGSNGIALLGNPYPSPINWNLFYADATGLNSNAKIWNGTNYTDLNNGDPSPIIYSGQGFLVQLTIPGSGGSVTFNNSHRVSGVTNTLLRTSEDIPQKLTVSITNDANKEFNDELILRFSQKATDKIDPKEDAFDLAGIPEVPSLTLVNSNEKLSTKCLPVLNGDKTLPLDVTIGEKGTYAFSLKGEENLKYDGKIYLVDKLSKSEYELGEEGIKLDLDKKSYQYYELQFRTESSPSLNAVTTNSFNAYASEGKIKVAYLGTETGDIEIMDLNGRVIATRKNVGSGIHEFEFNKWNTTQFYIVKFANKNTIETKKVIIQ